MRPLALAALVLAACHAVLDSGAPDLATSDFAPPPVTVNLLGDWQFTPEAQPIMDPTTLVVSNNANWINVSFSAVAGGCGCSARHLVVDLPRPFACSMAIMSFDWTTDPADFDATRSTALRVLFDPSGTNYGDQGWFFASSWVGHSNCAIDTGNQFPSPAQLVVGHNRVALDQLARGLDGQCNQSGRFTRLDIHVQGYVCAGNIQASLANLKFE